MPGPRRTALFGLAAALLLVLLVALTLRAGRDAPLPPPPPVPASGGLAALPSAAPGPPPAGLPIRLPPVQPVSPADAPARFEGRVVSAADGSGVGGAELTFSRAGAAVSVRSGAGGAFSFEPIEEGRWLLAAVTAPGFLPFAPEWGHSPVQLEAARGRQVRGVEIHLVPARPLVGKVVDPDGAPVAGAAVRLLGAAGEAALVPVEDRFTSGADGTFTFRAAEGAVLVARKEGYLPGRADVTALAAVNGGITVRLGVRHEPLGATGPIAGRVTGRDGAPVAGALVAAAPERGFGLVDAAVAQALTGADGRFRFPELDPGRYRVTARAEGRAPASARRVEPGAPELALVLEAGGLLRGCVRAAATGAPVAPFTVLVFERRSALRLVPQRTLSVIDPAGCYLVTDLAPGPAAVVVSAPGFAPSTARATEIPAPPGEALVDVALEAGGVAYGFVRDDATGQPLAGARVEVEGDLAAAASTLPVLSEAVTAADGSFRLGGLPARASLQVAAADHHARVVGGIAPRPGERVGPLEVRLRPVAPGETPGTDLAGIGVALAPRPDGLVVTAVSPGGGAAEAGLAAGDLILQVDGEGVLELGFGGAVDAIRGPEGTFVQLSLRRGDAMIEVRVPRRIVRGRAPGPRRPRPRPRPRGQGTPTRYAFAWSSVSKTWKSRRATSFTMFSTTRWRGDRPAMADAFT